jgi:hypothetical protein
MWIVGVLLVVSALSACESRSQDMANVRAAADAMEKSGSFAVEMTIDLEMPEPLTSVESTIHGRIDLSRGDLRWKAGRTMKTHGTRPLIRSRPGVLGGCGSPR